MSKARELLESGREEITLSSGVTVQVEPFPAGLWSTLQSKALTDHPDPDPPKKTVPAFGGDEEVDDLEDPGYKAALEEAETARNSLLGDAIIDLCVQVDLGEWEAKMARLERYGGEYPDDPDDRRVRFLKDYALRTKGDYEQVMVSATVQMMVSDPEVAARLQSFQRPVEGTADDDADAPGPDEAGPLDGGTEAEGA